MYNYLLGKSSFGFLDTLACCSSHEIKYFRQLSSLFPLLLHSDTLTLAQVLGTFSIQSI